MALYPWNNASEASSLWLISTTAMIVLSCSRGVGTYQPVQLLCHGTLHRVASSDDGDIVALSAP